MGGAGEGIMAPPSSIFEVLSGQGTLSLGLSLSSVRLGVCVQFLWTLSVEGKKEGVILKSLWKRGQEGKQRKQSKKKTDSSE